MRAATVLILTLIMTAGAFARNDFWLGSRYAVSLEFGASGLGKMNAPTPKSVPFPEYPAEMMRATVMGEVVVDFSVLADGSLVDPKIIHATDEAFRAASLAVLSSWCFFPAVDLETHQPTGARMRCRLRFSVTEDNGPLEVPVVLPVKGGDLS